MNSTVAYADKAPAGYSEEIEAKKFVSITERGISSCSKSSKSFYCMLNLGYGKRMMTWYMTTILHAVKTGAGCPVVPLEKIQLYEGLPKVDSGLLCAGSLCPPSGSRTILGSPVKPIRGAVEIQRDKKWVPKERPWAFKDLRCNGLVQASRSSAVVGPPIIKSLRDICFPLAFSCRFSCALHQASSQHLQRETSWNSSAATTRSTRPLDLQEPFLTTSSKSKNGIS